VSASPPFSFLISWLYLSKLGVNIVPLAIPTLFFMISYKHTYTSAFQEFIDVPPTLNMKHEKPQKPKTDTRH
jgi:hypothetical protein